MNIRKLPEEERPREKLLRTGKENLSTAEILAILLRSGTKEKSALELASELMTVSAEESDFWRSADRRNWRRSGG